MLTFIAKVNARGNLTISLKFLKENDNKAEAYLELSQTSMMSFCENSLTREIRHTFAFNKVLGAGLSPQKSLYFQNLLGSKLLNSC